MVVGGHAGAVADEVAVAENVLGVHRLLHPAAAVALPSSATARCTRAVRPEAGESEEREGGAGGAPCEESDARGGDLGLQPLLAVLPHAVVVREAAPQRQDLLARRALDLSLLSPSASATRLTLLHAPDPPVRPQTPNASRPQTPRR